MGRNSIESNLVHGGYKFKNFEWLLSSFVCYINENIKATNSPYLGWLGFYNSFIFVYIYTCLMT